MHCSHGLGLLEGLYRDTTLLGIPSFCSAYQSTTLGQSYAFLRLTNTRKILAQCSYDFSNSCLTVKIISEHPRPTQNPHCDTGSTSDTICNLCCNTLARTLTTTSNRAIPRQLSQHVRSPFLGIGMMMVSAQSRGTPCSFHADWMRSRRRAWNSAWLRQPRCKWRRAPLECHHDIMMSYYLRRAQLWNVLVITLQFTCV